MIARTTDTTLPEGPLFVARAADLGKPVVAWKKISGYEDKMVWRQHPTRISPAGSPLGVLLLDSSTPHSSTPPYR
jgi:hypothetical protein